MNKTININWEKVSATKVSIEKWNDTIDYLNKNEIPQYKAYKEQIPNRDGIIVQKKRVTSLRKLDKGIWFVYATSTYYELCIWCNIKPYIARYYVRSSDTNKKESDMTGYTAFSSVRDKYEELVSEKMTQDFGTNTEMAKKWRFELKKLVPSPFNWATSIRPKEGYWKNVKKADVSSAYPASLTLSLPTWNGAKQVKGYVYPTKEYPFAFHMRSRDIEVLEDDGTITSTQELRDSSEYMEVDKKTTNVYDKHVGERVTTRYNKFEDVDDSEEITILMKKVRGNAIAEIMRDLYYHRKDFAENKDIMNMFIGFCHFYKNPEYPQIAAVSQLRCAVNMVRRVNELMKHKCLPLLVNTDSISWKGDYVGLAVPAEKKDIGAFVLEYTDLDMNIASCKKYQYRTPDGVTNTFIAGAVGIATYKTKFKFGEFTIPGVKFSHNAFERNSGKFIEIEVE